MFQSEAKCEATDLRMIVQANNSLKALHVASFWKWEFLELRKGLLGETYFMN